MERLRRQVRQAGVSRRTLEAEGRDLVPDIIRSLSPEHHRVVGLEDAAVHRVADLQAEYDALFPEVADLRAEHRKLSEAVARFDVRVRAALQADEARKAGAAAHVAGTPLASAELARQGG